MFGCEEVPGRNYLALGMGAEPPLNDLVESHKVEMKLESRVRNLPVSAVPGIVTAGEVDVAEERCYDKHLSVAAHCQDPLQVGDCCRHGYLVGHDELTHHVKFVVLQLCNCEITPSPSAWLKEELSKQYIITGASSGRVRQ
jgi:hypothetical protein